MRLKFIISKGHICFIEELIGEQLKIVLNNETILLQKEDKEQFYKQFHNWKKDYISIWRK